MITLELTEGEAETLDLVLRDSIQRVEGLTGIVCNMGAGVAVDVFLHIVREIQTKVWAIEAMIEP